jgi:hypothetical protein
LYFTRPDHTALARLEGMGRDGRVVDRLTLFDAAESGAPFVGLDLSTYGTLTLRVLVPWRTGDSRLIGFIEMGREIGPLIDAVHRVLGVDVLMLVKKEMLDRDKWEEGERLSGRQDSWDEMGALVTAAQTLQSIPTAVGLVLENGPWRKGMTVIAASHRTLAVSVRPLVDLGNRRIGEMVILRDITGSNWDFTRTMGVMTVFAALVTLAAFLRCRSLLSEPPPAPPTDGSAEGPAPENEEQPSHPPAGDTGGGVRPPA